MPHDESWKYRGVLCEIEMDWDEDNRWSYKRVRLHPHGPWRDLGNAISRYDQSRESVEKWVDNFLDNLKLKGTE